MSHRCILLVDTDLAFHRMLTEQIGPYGVEVALLSPTDSDVLVKAGHLDPVLLIIAVEEPDKTGYSLCNKAKKGVAANLPVILVTATVAPKGFENHRKLKFHADEYVDKRGLNPAEIVGKIDNLISLGEPDDELQIPVEVDDLPFDLADAEVVESFDEGNEFADEEGRTSIASPHSADAILDGALDDAFAAITDFGDEPVEPVAAKPAAATTPASARAKLVSEPPPVPPAKVSLPPVKDLEVAVPGSRRATPPTGLAPPPVFESAIPEELGESDPSIGVPEPIDAHRDELEAEEVNAEWSGEIPEPIGDLADFDQEEATNAGGPPLAEMLRVASSQTAKPVPRQAPPMVEREPVYEATVVAAVPPMPEPEPEPLVELSLPPEPEPVPEAPPVAESPGLDLGLEEVAARADAEQSGVHDRRTLQQIGTLQRDNARLKAELEKARATETGNKSSGREREFLHLREMIAAKDKEILELRDELVVKDRQTIDGKEKIRQLQHTKTLLEGKNLEMEQRIIGSAERVEAIETARKELEVQAADLAARRAAVEAKAKADADSAAKALTERSAKATQLDRELTAERTRAGELARSHAETVTALARSQELRETELRAELERGRDDAVEALRAELATASAAQIAALEAEHAEALARKDRERGGAVVAVESATQARLAEHEQNHARELAAVTGQAERTLADQRASHQAALEAQRDQAVAALAGERARADQAVSDAAAHLEQVGASDKAAAEQAIAEATARAQDDLVAVVSAHGAEIDRLTAEHERAYHQLRSGLEEQAARIRAASIADRDRLVAEHAAALAAVTSERDRANGELGAARGEAETLRSDLTSLADRARQDLASATEKMRKDLDTAGRDRDQIVASLTTQNDAALSAANEDLDRVVTELRASAAGDLAELRASAARDLAELQARSKHELAALQARSEHELAELRADQQQVEQGLSSTRTAAKRLEDELAMAREEIAARERDVEAQAAAVAARDQRLAQLRGELDALEQENAGYQEQVLKAYQKIKTDEQTVTRAKKAMAIAMTLLDEEKKNAGGAG